MTSNEITVFYERDLRKLIDEIKAFKSEENLWKVVGTMKNPAGNLALHIIGGLNWLIGATLSRTGYIRHRDEEFSKKRVDRKIIIQQLEDLILLINKTVSELTPEQMDSPYPIFFDKDGATHSYMLTQLLLHLNYHLGQVNYLRRALE